MTKEIKKNKKKKPHLIRKKGGACCFDFLSKKDVIVRNGPELLWHLRCHRGRGDDYICNHHLDCHRGWVVDIVTGFGDYHLTGSGFDTGAWYSDDIAAVYLVFVTGHWDCANFRVRCRCRHPATTRTTIHRHIGGCVNGWSHEVPRELGHTGNKCLLLQLFSRDRNISTKNNVPG